MSWVVLEGEEAMFLGFNTVVPNLGSPDVLGLQVPEILANTASSEFYSENKVGNHCFNNYGICVNDGYLSVHSSWRITILPTTLCA